MGLVRLEKEQRRKGGAFREEEGRGGGRRGHFGKNWEERRKRVLEFRSGVKKRDEVEKVRVSVIV